MISAIKTIGAICLAAAGLCLVCSAEAIGAISDPVLVYKPEKPQDPKAKREPPPTGFLEGPCGLAVTPSGQVQLSDYYHDAVDGFNVAPVEKTSPPMETLKYVTQIANVDQLDGPCGLASSESGALYVNNFHRNVVNLTTHSTLALPTEATAEHLPTGVAVEAGTNRVYVDNRTYITAYEANGTQVMDGLEPLRIGADVKADYYGLAVTPTGRIYVSDATTNKVKVFEPALDKVTPVATISGPGKGFSSLRNSSLAIDKNSGVVYITDNLQPVYTEEPEAAVYVYSPTNALLGVLKYKVFDALPVGIAVDNSGGSNQGYVYVTSGNTDQAAVYGYKPGSQTTSFLPPSVGATVKFGGSGRGEVSSNTGEIQCSASCSAQPLAGSDITLRATPDAGSTFSGWSGDCAGGSSTCTVPLVDALSVGADFTADPAAEAEPAPGEAIAGAAAMPSQPATRARPRHRRRHHHRRRTHHHRATPRR
jgi:hypothetical protein